MLKTGKQKFTYKQTPVTKGGYTTHYPDCVHRPWTRVLFWTEFAGRVHGGQSTLPMNTGGPLRYV